MSSDATNATYTTVLGMCQGALKLKAATLGRSLKTADILEAVTEVTGMPSFSGVDKDRLVAELEERFTVVTGRHQTLGIDDDHVAWLPNRRASISWRYWDRYRLFMAERVPASAVESIDQVTDEVLSRIEDPQRKGPWDSRGLVMGHVQSGKTANYSGLICKAADAGYKVIIILAGIHNSLRSQTQIRMDEGFLGFMSEVPGVDQAFKRVGVGLIDPAIRANTGTNRAQLGDFNAKVASQFGIHPGGLPLVFVVKKHVGVLDNLIKWIRSCADAEDETTGRKYVLNVPALIIDDEADLASVDTKKQAFDEDGKPDPDHDPAKTNRNIRLLLRSFEKVAYVGYTATPFANIYIHDQGVTNKLGADLFPRNYIVNIPPPSNYMGPARTFGLCENEDAGIEELKALPIIRLVTDHADRNPQWGKKEGEREFRVDETGGWMPPKLVEKTAHIPRYNGEARVPPSLRQAIMAFLLATAVRRLREQGPRINTMLVHVVRYTLVQKRVADLVQGALKEILLRLRNGDGSRSPTILQEFEQLWKEDFIPTTKGCNALLEGNGLSEVAWDAVHPLLMEIAVGVRIKIINGSAGDILDYEEHRETGMDVIAIGGDKLSRGLTLDGLSVSYFLRSSKMYDTLMQMGRWFGYREKYIDVCRLYTTSELQEWFTHIAAASVELQQEFEYMASVGGKPKEYGLKVRSHPVMLVTSAVKMRHGEEMSLSFSGDISETTIFRRDGTWLKKNLEATGSWIASLGTPLAGGSKAEGYSWHTTVDHVLDLLGSYKTYDDVRRVDTALLTSYIKAQRKNGELLEWTVYLVSSGSAEHCGEIGGLPVGLTRRAPFPEQQSADRYTIRRLVNPVDESFDLTAEQKAEALARTISNWEKSTKPSKAKEAPTRPNGRESRQLRSKQKGLLLLYPLDPVIAKLPVNPTPIIGMAVSFPKSDTAKEITYTVNNVFTTRGGDDDGI